MSALSIAVAFIALVVASCAVAFSYQPAPSLTSSSFDFDGTSKHAGVGLSANDIRRERSNARRQADADLLIVEEDEEVGGDVDKWRQSDFIGVEEGSLEPWDIDDGSSFSSSMRPIVELDRRAASGAGDRAKRRGRGSRGMKSRGYDDDDEADVVREGNEESRRYAQTRNQNQALYVHVDLRASFLRALSSPFRAVGRFFKWILKLP